MNKKQIERLKILEENREWICKNCGFRVVTARENARYGIGVGEERLSHCPNCLKPTLSDGFKPWHKHTKGEKMFKRIWPAISLSLFTIPITFFISLIASVVFFNKLKDPTKAWLIIFILLVFGIFILGLLNSQGQINNSIRKDRPWK